MEAGSHEIRLRQMPHAQGTNSAGIAGERRTGKKDKQEARRAGGRRLPNKGENAKMATNEKVPPREAAGEAESEEE